MPAYIHTFPYQKLPILDKISVWSRKMPMQCRSCLKRSCRVPETRKSCREEQPMYHRNGTHSPEGVRHSFEVYLVSKLPPNLKYLRLSGFEAYLKKEASNWERKLTAVKVSSAESSSFRSSGRGRSTWSYSISTVRTPGLVSRSPGTACAW